MAAGLLFYRRAHPRRRLSTGRQAEGQDNLRQRHSLHLKKQPASQHILLSTKLGSYKDRFCEPAREAISPRTSQAPRSPRPSHTSRSLRPSRRGGGGVEKGGDACVALVPVPYTNTYP